VLVQGDHSPGMLGKVRKLQSGQEKMKSLEKLFYSPLDKVVSTKIVFLALLADYFYRPLIDLWHHFWS